MIREETVSQHNNSDQNNMYNNNNNNNSNKQTNENRPAKGSTSSNGSNSSASNAPTSAETQAAEKLVHYVYEYLLHKGASRAAQTFLSEIQWEKNIPNLGDAPGFLHNWWCVFWDLYAAAPERQDPHHTPEAKAFHDLNAGTLPSPSFIPQPTSDQLASMGGMGGYYQHGRPPSLSNAAGSPHGIPQGMMPSHFMNSRYAMGRPPSIRMPNQAMGPGGSPFSTMDPSRQQQGGPYNSSGINPAAMRNYNGMPVPPTYSRIPPMTNGAMMGGGPMGPGGGGPIGPTNMQMGPRGPWTQPTTPSPLTPGPPRTPILSSPQDPTTPFGMDPPEPQLPNIAEPPENLEELPQVESTESEAIKRIKESMKEEVKKFESAENNVPEYYNMH